MKQSSSFLFFLLFLCSVYSNIAALTTDSALVLYKKTFQYIEQNCTDSALFSIRQAYSHGLSDDSLFYAWAEIFTAKGALDTALALSLAAKASRDHPLYSSILKQRIFLYSATDQYEKAGLYLDTLNTLPAYRIRILIPQINCLVGGGFYQSEKSEATSLLYRDNNEYPQEQLRTAAKGGLGLKWNIPIKKGNSIEPALLLSASQNNPHSPFTLKNSFDSCAYVSALQIRYSHFSGKLSGGYEWKRSVDYTGDISRSHNLDIRFFNMLSYGYLFGETGYSHDMTEYTHNWYGFLYLNRDWSQRRSNALSLTISGFHDQEQVLRDSRILNMIYVDGFTFYSDSTFEKILPAPILPILFFVQDIVVQHDIVYAIIPQTYMSSNLKIAQSITGPHGLYATIDFEYGMNWYPQEYVWLDFIYSMEDVPLAAIENNNTRILSLNRQDGKRYWVNNISIIGKTIEFDSNPIAVHRKKRIDQTLSANAGFKKKIGKYIESGVNVMLSRTFSTLGDNAPVDIPVWSYRVMLSTNVRFNPEGILR